ncbi:unnamed protein product, partial [Brenthis ino]
MKLLIFLLLIASCYADIKNAGMKDFSTELLSHAQLETSGNIVISPFGLWTLLAAVASGASGNSRTELEKVLQLSSEQNTLIDEYKNITEIILESHTQDVIITSKNFVFLDKSFEVFDSFETTLTNDFNAQMIRLDFENSEAAAEHANTIIKESGATELDVLRADEFVMSKMILTNLISFKGLWQLPFNTSDTNVEPFYDENGNQIGSVKMMYQRAEVPFSNVQNLQAHVIDLPYGNNDKYSMLIVLPYPKIKLSEMYQRFTEVTLQVIFEKLDSDTKEFDLEEVDLRLPRFEINTNIVLNKPLNKMGIYDIFNQNTANFDKITTEKIYISTIVQKAKIEVTEVGTTASADTTANIPNRITTPQFIANRPFVYFIIERTTRTVLFNGIYSEPILF